MDSRVELLKQFYRGLPKDRAKIETYEHGFAFLEELLCGGVALQYAEMSFSGFLHKYKLSNIPDSRMDELMLAHVRKTSNLCLYFDDSANSLFCYNLDNNHKTNNTVMIPEMELAITLLREILVGFGCEPLVIASGRGYHLWCRLEVAVDNNDLYDFMLRTMARTLFGLHQKGCDHNKIKANFYPDPRTHDTVSLRLFGSEHMKNKVFSRILATEGLLDEEASWKSFEDHLTGKTIPIETFTRACDTIKASH